MLKFMVVGVFQGATYGLLAVGLVLVYKGTRTFNFAQGEFGTVAAYVTYALFANAGLPYGVAVLVGLLCAVLVGLIVERLVVRPLLNAPRLTLLVATVGVALFIISVTIIVGQVVPRVLAPAIPGRAIYIFGAGIQPQQLLILGALIALAALLALFFRTTFGLAFLATSQDSLATRTVGISVTGMSRFIWGFAALLGGIAGILQAPASGVFQPAFMTTGALIPAFAAAVLGGMTSLPGAFLAGEIIGVTQNMATFWLTRAGVPGSADLAVFALLLLTLLVRPRGLLGQEA
ncbi:MAG TPA: branched-chain amino acid ABC transporter permease [Actinomycetota bacterium]